MSYPIVIPPLRFGKLDKLKTWGSIFFYIGLVMTVLMWFIVPIPVCIGNWNFIECYKDYAMDYLSGILGQFLLWIGPIFLVLGMIMWLNRKRGRRR